MDVGNPGGPYEPEEKHGRKRIIAILKRWLELDVLAQEVRSGDDRHAHWFFRPGKGRAEALGDDGAAE